MLFIKKIISSAIYKKDEKARIEKIPYAKTKMYDKMGIICGILYKKFACPWYVWISFRYKKVKEQHIEMGNRHEQIFHREDVP